MWMEMIYSFGFMHTALDSFRRWFVCWTKQRFGNVCCVFFYICVLLLFFFLFSSSIHCFCCGKLSFSFVKVLFSNNSIIIIRCRCCCRRRRLRRQIVSYQGWVNSESSGVNRSRFQNATRPIFQAHPHKAKQSKWTWTIAATQWWYNVQLLFLPMLFLPISLYNDVVACQALFVRWTQLQAIALLIK